MVATCVSAIKGRVMRVVALDTCGNPVTGASSAVIVSSGFISVKMTPQYEDGNEYTQKTADGLLCVNQKDPSQLKRVNLDVAMCVLDPDMIVTVSGARLLNNGGATGTGAAFTGLQNAARFSLELWQYVGGARNGCNASGLQQYVYWAWPNVGNTQISDYTAEAGVSQFKFTAETDVASPLWGDGPGSGTAWITSPVQAYDHYLYNVTTTTPPTATCGAVLLT